MNIRQALLPDLDTLLQFSRETFYEFFAQQNDPVHFEAYVATAFTREKMHSELTNPDSAFYFMMVDSEIAGYIKINVNQAQNEYKNQNGLEVERIYVTGKQHRKGIGKALLNFAIQVAAQKQKDFIWLGVWEHNQKAIGFYRSQGFDFCGSHDFMLGGDRQTDLLMKKNIAYSPTSLNND